MPLREPEPERASPRGSLVLIGGTHVSDEAVLAMIHAAGGREARVVILPTASLEFVGSGQRYTQFFRRFGAKRVETADVVTRERAEDPAWAQRVEQADLIFLAGGDESLLLKVLSGTATMRSLLAAYNRGAIVAGIGAGAAVMGRFTPVDDRGGLHPSLALEPEIILDRRMIQSGHPGRLFYALLKCRRAGERLVGLRIDSDTAMVIGPQRKARVVGEGMVLVIEVPAGDADDEHHPGPASALVHVLPPGAGWDLVKHAPLSISSSTSSPSGDLFSEAR